MDCDGVNYALDCLDLPRIAIDGASRCWTTISRPNVPGREIDANYALQLMQALAAQQAADAASSSATTQYMQYVAPRPRNCTSSTISGIANTTCY